MNKKRSSLRTMIDLIGLVKPLTPIMIIAILMGVTGFLTAIFITVFGGYAILNVMGEYSKMSLKFIFIVVIIFALVRGLLRYVEQASNHYIAFKILALIRDKVFGALRTLSPAKLEGEDKGNLISILTSDIELLEVFYAHTISPICIAIVLTIIMVAYIGSYNYVLGVIAFLAYITVGVIIPLVASKNAKKLGFMFRDDFGNMNAYFLDSLRGIKETIQYDDGDNRLKELINRTTKMEKNTEKMKNNLGLNMSITSMAIMFFSVLILVISSMMYSHGFGSIEGVIIPTISMFSSFGAVVAVANLGSNLTQTIASGNRVLDILSDKPITEEITNGKDINVEGAEFSNVTFSYDNEKILDNINTVISPGKITGITGKSGSGKTTLLKLLMRFWDVDSGKITVSGVDIRDINTKSLRNNQGYVTQNTHLFNDTIENNIKIANLDATLEDVISACKKSSIHDFIMSLPEQYKTKTGELGSSLSEGEKQRIGLARAFLHNAPLILLDEPTSNIDSLNEAVILKSLKNDKNRTIILVSHRLSTMNVADKIYSVERGRLS